MLETFVFIGGAFIGAVCGAILAGLVALFAFSDDHPLMEACIILWFVGAAVAGGIAALTLV